MMTIDMTAALGSLITGLQVMLLVASSALAVSVWRSRSRPVASSPTRLRHLAIVGASPSVPANAVTPSDTSVPEAA